LTHNLFLKNPFFLNLKKTEVIPTADNLWNLHLPPGGCNFSCLFFDRLLAPGMLAVSSEGAKGR